MWAARAAMLSQGVRYAGRSRHSAAAARAISGMNSPFADEPTPPSIRHWNDLVREVRRAREPRVVVSSEFLAHSSPETAREIVDQLDPERVHIAVTLRPVGRILTSRWQQHVQTGSTQSFGTWLEATLGRDGELPDVPMWHHHRHDRLVARWADVVGPERLTVIVADERDHTRTLRVFEDLLGLRPGTLELQQEFSNRSLTLCEAEAVRALNARVRSDGLSRATAWSLVHNGAARYVKMRTPRPGEPRVELPRWASDRAAEVSSQAVAGIAASGVRIVGDLDSLLAPPAVHPPAETPTVVDVPPDIAGAMAMGVAYASGARGRVQGGEESPDALRQIDEQVVLGFLSGRELARILADRVRASLVRRLRFRS